jgi:hypothetical protein
MSPLGAQLSRIFPLPIHMMTGTDPVSGNLCILHIAQTVDNILAQCLHTACYWISGQANLVARFAFTSWRVMFNFKVNIDMYIFISQLFRPIVATIYYVFF